MKNLKLHSVISIFLLVGMTTFTSCGKGTDVSDKDDVGKFELTIDGKKETGTKVSNGAAIGIRTISAENSNIEFGILINEEDFNTGAVIELSGATCYLNVGKTTTISNSGSVKVKSKSKIEIENSVFTGHDDKGNLIELNVSGYISSK